jgi:hypothetical protein
MKIHCLLTAALLSSTAANAQLSNLGLVGVGRFPAHLNDVGGADTFGGFFSGLDLDPFFFGSGDFFFGLAWGLPDRGFGDGLTDYHPRVQGLFLSVAPYYGPYPAPHQSQINFSNVFTFIFTQNDQVFTGFLPEDTNVTTHPQSFPDSPGGGRWSLDPEGLARTPNGMYVSDEYGPYIYHFTDFGGLIDVIVPPEAYIPKRGSTFPRVNRFGVATPESSADDSGRWVNRGLEGLSATPDGKKLVTMLQSPAIQDGEDRNPSRNTRILIYDIDPSSATYHQPIAEYVYQCTLNAAEAGNRHTPVSEIRALSDTQFLVLERDSRGRGGEAGPILYKKVVLADVSAASNIVGTGYDLEKDAPGQLSLGGNALPAGIVPAARRDLVNIADPNQLARFGLNVSTNWDANTLCEKWEGLAVIPLNDPAAPNDFLLLIGNDNDFKAPVVIHNGEVVGENDLIIDNMLLAFRIGIDTTPPSIVCPDPLTLECGVAVDLRDRVTATDNAVDPVTIIQTPPAGTLLPVGTHTISFVGEDAAGNRSEPCSTTVTIQDRTAPTIASIQASPNELTVNGQLVPVTLVVEAVDSCDSTVDSRIVSVTSNPPADSTHWEITGPLTVKLKAIPRVYVITVESIDDAGNATQATTSVTVNAN